MQFGTTLKTYCPPKTGELARNRPGKLRHLLSRWFPFVFPWSPLQRMTGIIHSGSEITMAHGRVDGKSFNLDRVIHQTGDDPISKLKDLDLHDLGPVCISLLRNRALVRHFRVPAVTDAEIETMIPHLLAGELPQSIEHFSWVWTSLPARDLKEGFSQISVYVVRNDRLEESLFPLADVGLDIAGVVPEGWSWAHIIDKVWSPEHPSDELGTLSIIIRSARAHLLIVERDGKLLFDMILPLAACPEASSEGSHKALDWDGPGFSEAREQYETLLGSPLPKPDIWPDALQAYENFEEEDFFFAASVATTGLGREKMLAPPKLQQHIRRRTVRRTLTKLVRLGAMAAMVWVFFAVFENIQLRQYLLDMEEQIRADAPRVEALELEYDAVQENMKSSGDSKEILEVLASLRLHVKTPIYLAHLNYVQDRGVTLRGGAPASSNVLEMTDQLTDDPLWESLRVMQLQSEKRNGTDQVNFVVEGQLQ